VVRIVDLETESEIEFVIEMVTKIYQFHTG